MASTITISALGRCGLLSRDRTYIAIFISTLAFEDAEIVNLSQIAVLLASLMAALLGGSWLITMIPNSLPSEKAFAV